MLIELASIWKSTPQEVMAKLNLKPAETIYG